VRQGVDFKSCLLVYKCLHQLAPVYLTSLLTPVTAIATRRHSRHANGSDLVTLRTRTVGLGPRSFSAAGQSVCRQSLRIRHWLLDISPAASWRQSCVYVSYPCPSIDNILKLMFVWRITRKII